MKVSYSLGIIVLIVISILKELTLISYLLIILMSELLIIIWIIKINDIIIFINND